jgi:hypothetical protein
MDVVTISRIEYDRLRELAREALQARERNEQLTKEAIAAHQRALEL